MKNQKDLKDLIGRRDLLKLGVAGLGAGVATKPLVVSEEKWAQLLSICLGMIRSRWFVSGLSVLGFREELM